MPVYCLTFGSASLALSNLRADSTIMRTSCIAILYAMATNTVSGRIPPWNLTHCRFLKEYFPTSESFAGRTQIGAVRHLLKAAGTKISGVSGAKHYPSRAELFSRLYHQEGSPYTGMIPAGGRRLDSASRTRNTLWTSIEAALGFTPHFIVEVGSFVGKSATEVWGPLASRSGGWRSALIRGRVLSPCALLPLSWEGIRSSLRRGVASCHNWGKHSFRQWWMPN